MKREYRKPLFRKIYRNYVLIAFGVLGVFLAFGLTAFRDFHYESTRESLEARSLLVSPALVPLLDAKDYAGIQKSIRILGRDSGTRFTVILPDGRVVADSERDPAGMDNHADRPEVEAALKHVDGTSVRHSHTLDQDHMYLAHPIERGDEVIGVVRASLPLYTIDTSLWRFFVRLIYVALILMVIAALVSWRVSSVISNPLERMKNLAESIAQGDFSARVRIERGDPAEIERLGRAMNKIAIQLSHRIQEILEQKSEQEAVFASMAEGVIAVDAGLRIVDFNDAAGRVFGLERGRDLGRLLYEVVRMTDLRAIAERATESDSPVKGELTVNPGGSTGEERFLQVNGAALRSSKGTRSGAVLVFNDVTHLRALENHRRDFVSNVSHELRTPLTSIQGFVETLLDGAYLRPEESQRFLGIIQRQAGRLAAIVEDLLDLSKIEAQSERKEITLTMQPLRPLLEAAIEVCLPKATAKGISIELECPVGARANVNAPLLEQAVINLVDNAIKYSENTRPVRVLVEEKLDERGKDRVLISVRDQGAGIPREHLGRLFERFYRVDKARSRVAGGTGLGLAIVKHIAIAHGGSARVESEPGKGSQFTLDLPKQSQSS